MSNVYISKSATKARKTNQRNVLGIIPNNAIDFAKQVAETNRSSTARVNYKLFATDITAFSGGGKTDATQLDTREVQIVVNVDASGDSVKLPKAVANMYLRIVNKHTTNDIDVFSYDSDSLEGSSIAAVNVLAGETIEVLAISGSEWILI